MKRLAQLLLNKSQKAFLLGLEIYNKPTVQYRIEAFCFFFTNAWELLLKAYILEESKKENSIFYPKNKGQARKSISLRDAIERVFFNKNDPIRKNIEDIANLRDEATHLIIQELEFVYVGLFQAGVLNYFEKLKEWFCVNIFDKISPAMLSLIVDMDEIDPIILKKKYGKEVADFFIGKRAEIENNASGLKDKRYNISIEYKLALVKNPKKADITLSVGPDGRYSGRVIEVPKDPSTTHPYSQKNCISLVKEKIGDKIVFNSYDFQAILNKEKFKNNLQYHYCYKPFGNNVYSSELIDFITNKVNMNSEYLSKTRVWHKNDLLIKKGKQKI